MVEHLKAGLIRFPHIEELIGQSVGLSDGTILDFSASENDLGMFNSAGLIAGEIPLVRYVSGRERGSGWLAIPVFTTRRFTQWMIEVPQDSNIHEPKDLEGKRVLQSYAGNTDEVWTRGLLEETYGVDPSTITWFTRQPELVPGTTTPPTHVNLNRPDDRDALMLEGVVDAAITSGHPLPPRPGFRYMWEDPEGEAATWYQSWPIFPMLHTMVFKEELLEEHANLAQDLYEIFEKAKQDAFAKWEYGAATPGEKRTMAIWSGFPVPVSEEIDRRYLGKDPIPYGLDLKANYEALDRLLGYAFAQGVVQERHAPEDVFASVTS